MMRIQISGYELRWSCTTNKISRKVVAIETRVTLEQQLIWRNNHINFVAKLERLKHSRVVT